MARTKIAYGTHSQQFGHVFLPDPATVTGPVPAVMVVHGGSWHGRYQLTLGTALSVELARRGVVAWNVEYRRLEAGGAWDEMSADVVAAYETIFTEVVPHAQRGGVEVDLDRVRLVGHSAGGQLAVWLAGESTSVRPEFVVSQAGALDLVTAGERGRSVEAFEALFGASYAEAPECYRSASPTHRPPIGVPVAVLHGTADEQVPVSVAHRYVDAADAAGDPVLLELFDGEDHVAFLNRSTRAWARSLDLLTVRSVADLGLAAGAGVESAGE
ncbi:alpha/beta hydrolase family protein [Rhodococcus pyridinivorans]|uniref:alpha/beta hydrolase family protein n=1 Tax=Rhodococcus pyridinivorans TaxID=103816 RepID=UPI0019070197|nr:prolyl oligopeptidase family serine peptidase [Rhodococcus pyridinivorans]QQM51739.1 prolyl oligopeptidase family serine peptidase [Rhodococcus pyridinivorans]